MGFMFAYNEPLPSYKLYHETPIESKIFERLFPKVLLIDRCGDGEFGRTTTRLIMSWDGSKGWVFPRMRDHNDR